VNDILSLLGTEYSLRLEYRPSILSYEVTVIDNKGHLVDKPFPVLKVDTAMHDVLLCTVEQCILDLKERKE